MKELSKALDDFSRIFERLNVEYAVMGGIAVRAHGIPRPTQDVDFTVAIERSRLPEFLRPRRGQINCERVSNSFGPQSLLALPLLWVRRTSCSPLSRRFRPTHAALACTNDRYSSA